jgi:hypothetical protein
VEARKVMDDYMGQADQAGVELFPAREATDHPC